ncbi:uncharacterized protein LOC122499561 isoform X2 [Leptopilina heterotoma]|uniref:uncharacterized protein LOC122499561 isoform X2 n=1 Tax=Leptopilina heterotoma TaxID=63436 RepID=UPI001CA85817|nr:uncharacterized protein LOC122499561 isoform X2 [Leptopilina heterotoma]
MSQQRRGSMHGGNSVTNHGSSNNLHITSHEIQNHGIPLPGMVPTRSILGNSVLGNPIHGFVNPLGPMGPSHSPPTHSSGMIGISHHPSRYEKVPPGSPYSGHGSPLRSLVSSSHGTSLETSSPQLVRHRQDSENTIGISARRSSDVASSLLESQSLLSAERVLRRLEYGPQQGMFKTISLSLFLE